MFAVIETKGATHVLIHIPHDGATASLPALARLLESNAVFVRKGYSDADVVLPEMSVVLGDTYRIENTETVIAVSSNPSVLDESFVNCTPAVMISNAAARKRDADELARLRTELNFTKQQRDTALEQIQALTEIEA